MRHLPERGRGNAEVDPKIIHMGVAKAAFAPSLPEWSSRDISDTRRELSGGSSRPNRSSNLSFLNRRNTIILSLSIFFFKFSHISTIMLIPNFLGNVAG